MKQIKKNYLKYVIGFVLCFLFRFIPFKPPNIEPILTAQMPFARIYGKFAGFSFGFLSIIIFDLFTSGIGMWTFITAITYGFLGLWAISYFKNKKNNALNYAKFAVMGTIVYDIITGLSVGPLFFNQSLMEALVGQIPFTLLHLIGNVSFAIILSPIIYTYTLKNKNTSIIKKLNICQLVEKKYKYAK